MNRYLISTSDPSRYPLSRPFPYPDDYESPYHLCVETAPGIMLIANPTFELADPTDRLIGAWDRDGVPQSEINQELYSQIRPFGNAPPRPIYDDDGNQIGQTRGGDATRHLGYHAVSGDGQRVLGDIASDDPVVRLYPADQQAFLIEFRHLWLDDPPPKAGWAFRGEIVGGAAARDPATRKVSWYADAECTNILGTAANFRIADSLWQVDDEGNPLRVWAVDTPPNVRSDDVAFPWHVAVTDVQGTQEGYLTLPQEGSVTRLFWARTQGAV